jgi:hypothetical protein
MTIIEALHLHDMCDVPNKPSMACMKSRQRLNEGNADGLDEGNITHYALSPVT